MEIHTPGQLREVVVRSQTIRNDVGARETPLLDQWHQCLCCSVRCHVGRRNCTELRNEGIRNCSSAILVQRAIPAVDARRRQASDATGTGQVSFTQQPLERELRWKAEFALVLLGDRPLHYTVSFRFSL